MNYKNSLFLRKFCVLYVSSCLFMLVRMSPTMQEGGIASWKKQAGDSFSAGDVILEIVNQSYCLLSFLLLNYSLILLGN